MSYRSVVRAMGAMGLDFVLATEHASDSEQVIDADIRVSVGLDSLLSVHQKGDTLRDMNKRRFHFNNGLIHGSGGANGEAALEGGGSLPQNVLGHGVVPQILLGGEIDAIPEVGPGEAEQSIEYGNGLRYNPSHYLCKGWHGELWVDNCNPANLWEPATDGVLIKDAQGLNELRYGREHMVYMPHTSAPDFVDDDGGVQSSFVSSQTSEFGGAQRRLGHDHRGHAALLPEITRKGHAFLAHPLNAPRPGSEGPDGVPWSEHMLETAFRSEGILGLQIWNLNSRRVSSVHSSVNSGGGPAVQLGYERSEGPFGPKHYHTFRRGLLNGRFELRPWDSDTGEWDKLTKKRVDKSLQDSTFVWDKILRWGLDPIQRAQVPWLEPTEPRRFFMAGGSDAHGDLNYHRSGYFNGISKITDSAIGSPRNLLSLGSQAGATVPVEGGEARLYEHREIVDGLASGNFTVTDGPALRIAVDVNGNGRIDDADVPMGGVLHQTRQQTDLPLLVEWKSTQEFGEVARIDIYLGVQSATIGRTYAPYRHGPRARGRGLGEGIEYPDAYGRKHELLDDNYWHVQERAGTRLRISGPPIGPVVPMCEARLRLCLEGGFENPDAGIPNVPLCKVEAFEVPCADCPTFQSMEGYLSCQQTEVLPPDYLPLPSPSFSGTRRLDLDLSAFEASQNQRGEGFYVRAFARTKIPREPFSSCYVAGGECNCDIVDGECIERFAFTNPIWVLLDAEPECDEGDPDRDGDGIPDDCDPCPHTSDDVCIRKE